VDSECSERTLLIEQYVSAVNAYGTAVNQKRAVTDLRIMRQVTLKASELCEKTLKAFLDHEQRHGCGKTANACMPEPESSRAHAACKVDQCAKPSALPVETLCTIRSRLGDGALMSESRLSVAK
jgi:hypothetical protein